MESAFSHNESIVHHTLLQMVNACQMITSWNKDIASVDDYLHNPEGMQKLAATCMLLESIGEGAKKIDRLIPDFLESNAPEIPWKSVKGLRDHIAHGYFNIDADIIYDIVANELRQIEAALSHILSLI
jgi:uncharacterized protein with HEPN domain